MRPRQDALGLITIYPRPDEPSYNPLQLTGRSLTLFTTIPKGRSHNLQHLTQPFSFKNILPYVPYVAEAVNIYQHLNV